MSVSQFALTIARSALADSTLYVSQLKEELAQVNKTLSQEFALSESRRQEVIRRKEETTEAIRLVIASEVECTRLRKELETANREKLENAKKNEWLVQRITVEVEAGNAYRKDYLDAVARGEETARIGLVYAEQFHLAKERASVYYAHWQRANSVLAAVTAEAQADTEALHEEIKQLKKKNREVASLVVEPAHVRPAKRAAIKRNGVYSDSDQ